MYYQALAVEAAHHVLSADQVTWLDRRGAVSQVWLDNNRDGRADVVRLYRKGKLLRTVRR